MAMQPDLTESLKKRQQINRYSRWMYNNFKDYIGNRVLDIGSGTGNIISFFIDKCEKVVATDIFPSEIEYMKERFTNNNNLECRVFNISDDDIDELKGYSFDTITCINVLEHIEDDFEALKKMKQIVINNGIIILLVPAFYFLFGTLDKKCGHFRRYNKNILKEIAIRLDLKVIAHKYFNIFGIIPWYIKGKILKKDGTFSDTLNENNSKIYNLASWLLEPFERIIKVPLGISEVIVLQKVGSELFE